MKIKLINLVLVLAIVCLENLFYLVDQESIPVGDIGLVLLLVIAIFAYVYPHETQKTNKARFKFLILLIIPLVLISSYQSYALYGQGFLLGLRPQRHFLIPFLMYFPLRRLINSGRLSRHKLDKILYYIATIELVLYLLQYFLNKYFNFLHVYTGLRHDSVRYYFDYIIFVYILFKSTSNWFKGIEKRKNLCYIIAVLTFIYVALQSRMLIVSILGALVVGIILWHNFSHRKLLVLVVGIVLGISFLNTDLGRDIVSVVTSQSDDLSYQTRLAAREYWGERLKNDSSFFGCGFMNIDYYPAAVAAGVYGQAYPYLFTDNGIYGFEYQYGLIGVAWILSIYVLMAKYAYKVARKEHNYLYAMFTAYSFFEINTGLQIYQRANFALIFIIILILLEQEYNSALVKGPKNSM